MSFHWEVVSPILYSFSGLLGSYYNLFNEHRGVIQFLHLEDSFKRSLSNLPCHGISRNFLSYR